MKTLAGLLTSKWVVGAEWVTQCHAQKKILPEKDFGKKGKSSPFAETKFFVSPVFVDKHNATDYKNLQLLLTVAKAKITYDNTQHVQYVIVSDTKEGEPTENLPNGIILNFAQFVSMVEKNHE